MEHRMTITDGRTATLSLPDDLLGRCRTRAAAHDRDNTYFTEDLAELAGIGYLRSAVPEHHGGWGLDLGQVAAQQRRLARHAPATALGTTMHFYWLGIARELERFGDDSCSWILREAAAGKVFAAGHAESGNDAPVVMSTAKAQRAEGGYRFTGRKMFGSNGPVWDYLGVHALDVDAEGGPQIVHGFVERQAPGVQVLETWDTLGMRASQSHDTLLAEVFVPDARIGRTVPAGQNDDLFLFAMNIWALSLIGNVYLGIADRALELAAASARSKSSVAIPRGLYAYNPFVQHQLAEMYLELDAASATVDRLVEDWLAGTDHGARWGAQIVSAKWRAVTAARRVVDLALEVSGGGGMFKGNELERLYRDVRCGGFHPANDALTHESVARFVLGFGADEPRW
ncbi:MAG: acyl-CoA dehydrogenase [Acidimicrobiia bacterium]|nr:acyl-CoA dehydrogenase [Acidimicrobiia bacterium]